ncbi:hypothetical protein AAVH_37493, partial [Aphelenchoides avenae]
LETALPRIEDKINALERQLNETDRRRADLEAQTKLLKAILWALGVTICVVILLVVLAFGFNSIKGAVMTWWRRRDGSGRMNLIDDA